MRCIKLTVFVCLLVLAVWAQSDRGTITGTIADPAGAVVANAPIELRNIATGALYQAASSSTGNYTLAQVPAGSYELSVTVPGFKRYVRQDIVVQVAQTLRLDVALEVGATTDSVTVTGEVTLLKTESGELAYNTTSDRLNALPILNVNLGTGAAAMRSPYAVIQLAPGTYWNNNNALRVNGAPANTQALRIEGQDSTNGLWALTPAMTQPSVDAIQEFSVQTSNYAAEFGQAGGGLLNLTMRSGSNSFHGSAYEYLVNDAFASYQPFLNVRPARRRHDYGFTAGGPLGIPRLYSGKDRTFFFLNWEWFRDNLSNNNILQTVPTDAYRSGNFAGALTSRAPLTTDTLGRQILEGQIYDPRTQRVVNGATVRDPYPGNIVPAGQLDPVALKVQGFIPRANLPGPFNNYLPVFPTTIRNNIPAVKIDHNLSSTAKLTGYWSSTTSDTVNLVGFGQADGMPNPITQARSSFLDSQTIRISYDQSVTPTMLLHLGAGMVRFLFRDDSNETNFNSLTSLGLKGIPDARGRFPYFTGLNTTNGTGGMINMGPLAQSHIHEERPTANASFTWVRSNHTFKGGAEMVLDGYPSTVLAAAVGVFNFSANSTSNPYLILNNPVAGVNAGFPYASFLLGAVDNGNIGLPASTRLSNKSFAVFLQDSWKVTRKLTLDYGLRWDYLTYFREQYGRMPSFGATTPNPSADGRPGAIIFEGNLPGRCQCQFASAYPYAIGPRLGGAYQLNPKTVIRAGFGVVYSKTANNGFVSQTLSANNQYQSPGQWAPATYLQDGVPIVPVWPNFSPGQQPAFRGQLGTAQPWIDPNAGRPPRQMQWSVSIQRELARNLAVEASYIGNRGAYWQANGLVDYNRISPDILAARGLNLNNPADQTLLLSAVNSPTAIARGFGLPYPSFPATQTVAQSLRPYPQFGGIGGIPARWAPLGRTWYDSLQARVIKRLSHGLDLTYTFTFQREFTLGAESEDNSAFAVPAAINDVYNRSLNKTISGFSQPFQNVIAANYTLPKWGGNKALSWAIRDWTMSGVFSYRSGLPIMAPQAQNQINQMLAMNATSFMNRVPGVPLFVNTTTPNQPGPAIDSLNCRCYDPAKAFVLNPAAWANPPRGQFGTASAYYNDYRYQRRPAETFALGRVFRFGPESRMQFSVRAEFTNIFNRTQPPNPTSTNSLATQTRNAATGLNSGGFGFVNAYNPTAAGVQGFQPPRQGTIVARFQF
jgi:hypothetical protein